jgi:hypothetical protein
MITKVKKVILLFMGIGLLLSCETEFDSYVYSDPIPIIYGLINPDDSLYQIRVSRTYVGEGSALDLAKINDSIYFDDAEVILETYHKKRLLQSVALEKTQIGDRVAGIFSSSPNYVYQTDFNRLNIRTKDIESIGLINELDLRLSVVIPDRQDTIRGYSRLIAPPHIVSPKSGYQKVYLYGEIPFHMEWSHTVSKQYYEILIKLRYKEVYDEHEEEAEVEWILKGIEYNESSIPGGTRNYYAYYFRPESFYSQISAVIKKDPYVKGRVIRSIDFVVLTTDASMREYNRIGELQDDYRGASYSNIENGFGLFSTFTSTGVYNLRLGQRELDSLAFGKYTRHLGFKNWE